MAAFSTCSSLTSRCTWSRIAASTGSGAAFVPGSRVRLLCSTCQNFSDITARKSCSCSALSSPFRRLTAGGAGWTGSTTRRCRMPCSPR